MGVAELRANKKKRKISDALTRKFLSFSGEWTADAASRLCVLSISAMSGLSRKRVLDQSTEKYTVEVPEIPERLVDDRFESGPTCHPSGRGNQTRGVCPLAVEPRRVGNLFEGMPELCLSQTWREVRKKKYDRCAMGAFPYASVAPSEKTQICCC
jgi:hypothetical protein